MRGKALCTTDIFNGDAFHFVLACCDIGVEEDTFEVEALGHKELPRSQGCNCDKCKMCVGAWFCKFVAPHLPSFVVCLCGGVDDESCAGPSNERASVDVEFEVV